MTMFLLSICFGLIVAFFVRLAIGAVRTGADWWAAINLVAALMWAQVLMNIRDAR